MSFSIARVFALRWTAVVGLVAGSAVTGGAQQADSLPFRTGQWGVEFTAADFAGVGALRFLSARNALLFNVQGRITRQSGSNNDNASLHLVNDSDEVQARFGWRRYAPLAPRIVRHVGLGVQAFRGSSEQQIGSLSTSVLDIPLIHSITEGFGAYAEVGAQWMITRNLSLGASWSASASATRQYQETVTLGQQTPRRTERTTTGFTGLLGPLAVRAAIYF